MIPKRNFLLLQGPATPFFNNLGQLLERQGSKVFRILFNAGDSLFWRNGSSIRFSGKMDEWSDFLEHFCRQHDITDLVLFGDRRPLHRLAVNLAEHLAIKTHVFEEGYFRPYWITLERDGVNGHSLLPRDPDWFRAVAPALPETQPFQRFRSPFWKRAVFDVAYHVAGALNPLLFPHYQTHALDTAPIEYAGYVHRFSRMPLLKRADRGRIASLLSSKNEFFVLPLQLNTDAQIRDHSRFQNMDEVIHYVLSSFSAYAAPEARLVIKNHPLDYGFSGFSACIQRAINQLNLNPDRVIYLESGSLDQLVHQSAGMVTVNSTSGMVALQHQRPVIALSDPIYNLPGLTFQAGLDAFWTGAARPDTNLMDAFERTVMFTTQVNGSFYCEPGITLAAANAAQQLTAEMSPLEQLLSLKQVAA